MKTGIFEYYPKITLSVLGLFFLIIGSLIIEKVASSLFGLGKTVLYQTHPVYGYRPLPNQTVARNAQHIIHINNLGLRANEDWDNNSENKILFLGDSVTYGGSYVANSALFSHLAIAELQNFKSANAGVNGWGVDNVHALITKMEFLPAQLYVSTFPEGDFYRGLQRIGGQPFWTRQPKFALEELFHYFLYKMQLRQMPMTPLSLQEQQRTVELAIKNLVALDNYLKSHNKQHIIFITPTQNQVAGLEPQDAIVKALLNKYQLPIIYLKDKIDTLPIEQKEGIFHDSIHLTPKGHALWASLIAPELHRLITKLAEREKNNP